MKIRRVELNRIGRYQGEEVGVFPDGLTVLYGHNEAGKSTLLAGLRGLLFGRATLSETEVSTPSGAFGRMLLESEDGQQIQIERTLSRKMAPKLLFPDGTTSSGQSALTAAFAELNEIEETLYKSVFTFQLSDLRDVRDKGDVLQNRIYSASMLGGYNPAMIESGLEQSVKQIFNAHKRATNAQLNQCLHELDAVTEQLRGIHDKPEDYQQMQAHMIRVDTEIEQLEAEAQVAQRAHARLLRFTDGLPVLQAWLTARSRLQAYRHLPEFTAERAAQVEHVKGHQAELSRQLAGVREEIDTVQRSIEGIMVDSSMFEAYPQLRTWQEQSAVIMERDRQMQHLKRELQQLEQSESELLDQLSGIWDGDTRTRVDLSNARLQQIQELNQTYAEAELSLKKLEKSRTEKLLDVAQTRQALQGLTGAGEFTQSQLKQRRQSHMEKQQQIRDDENLLHKWSEQVQVVQLLESELAGKEQLARTASQTQNKSIAQLHGRLLRTGWVGSASLAVIAVLLYVHAFWLPAVLCTVLAGGLTFWNWRLSQHGRSVESVSTGMAIDQDCVTLHARISRTNEILGQLDQQFRFINPQGRDISVVPELQAQLRRTEQSLQEDIRQTDRLEERLERATLAQTSLQRVEFEQDAAQNHLNEVCSEWLQVCGGLLGQSVDISISAFLAEAQVVQTWRKIARQMGEKRTDIADLELQIDSFCSEVGSYFASLDGEQHRTDEQVPRVQDAHVRLNLAVQQAEAAQTTAGQRREYEVQLESLQKRETELVGEITGLEQQQDAAYHELGVTDWTSYAGVLQQLQERDAIQKQCSDAYHRLFGFCGGTEAQIQTTISELDGVSETELQEQLTASQEKLRILKEETKTKTSERGVLAGKLRDLESLHTSSELAWQQSALRTKRNRLATEWAELVIAKAIAKQTRRAYEEANQPRALLAASEILCEISDGRYVAIKSRMEASGDMALYCVDAKGQAIDVAVLSRGTKEQIYLALRFAVIRIYRDRGIIMPVVLDDPMVNFDGSRTQRYFARLTEEAQGHQFIYLTCHQHMVELARRQPGIHVMDLVRTPVTV